MRYIQNKGNVMKAGIFVSTPVSVPHTFCDFVIFS